MSDYQTPIEDLTRKSVGIYYKDNPAAYSEEWQIVFDKNGKNPQMGVIHDYLTFDTDEELYDFMDQEFDDIVIVGLTYQDEIHHLGSKRIGSDEREESTKRIDNLYKLENHILQLRNECEMKGGDVDDLQETIDILRELPKEEYAIYAKAMADEMKDGFFVELTKTQADRAYAEYFIRDAAQELALQKYFIQDCRETNKYFKGIRYDQS